METDCLLCKASLSITRTPRALSFPFFLKSLSKVILEVGGRSGKQKSIKRKHDPADFPGEAMTICSLSLSVSINRQLACRESVDKLQKQSRKLPTGDEIYMERQRRGSMTLVALSGYSEYQGIAERITGCLENPRIPRPKVATEGSHGFDSETRSREKKREKRKKLRSR